VFSIAESAEKESTKIPSHKLRQDPKLISLFQVAIDAASNEDGWANLGGVGSNIIKNAPDFDPRNYGYAKLADLAKAIELFDIEKHQTHLLLRNKQKK